MNLNLLLVYSIAKGTLNYQIICRKIAPSMASLLAGFDDEEVEDAYYSFELCDFAL